LESALNLWPGIQRPSPNAQRPNDRILSWLPDSVEHAFERKLYVIRKVIESTVAARRLKEVDYFYISSLSCRTVIYKGLLMAHQINGFYQDLRDPKLVTALALVHQRFSTNTFPTWDLAHP